MKEILQALKILAIFALYPLYFIGYTYDSFCNYNWSIELYFSESWFKMITLIIWLLILTFGIL